MTGLGEGGDAEALGVAGGGCPVSLDDGVGDTVGPGEAVGCVGSGDGLADKDGLGLGLALGLTLVLRLGLGLGLEPVADGAGIGSDDGLGEGSMLALGPGEFVVTGEGEEEDEGEGEAGEGVGRGVRGAPTVSARTPLPRLAPPVDVPPPVLPRVPGSEPSREGRSSAFVGTSERSACASAIASRLST